MPAGPSGAPLRVTILTPYEAWRDGQARKEARSLAVAGTEVTLIGYGAHRELIEEDGGYRTVVLGPPPTRWRADQSVWWPLRVAVNTALNTADALKGFLPAGLAARGLVHRPMLRAALASAPDVVHAHNPHTLLTGWTVAHRTGAHLIADFGEHFVGYFTLLGYPRFVQAGCDWVERRVLPRADAVIATSPLTAGSLQARFCLDQVEVLANSLPLPEQWAPAEAMRCHTPVRILSRGGVRPNLRYEMLIEAMAHLRGRATLTIQGIVPDQSYERQLHDLIDRLNLNDTVTFTGRYDPLESCWFAEDFDIGVGAYPIAYENLEFALSCRLYAYMNGGLVLAMSDSAAHRQFPPIESAGVLLDTTSAKTIADSLAPLVDDPARIIACKAAAARLAPAYSWESQEDRLIKLYQRVLGTTGR